MKNTMDQEKVITKIAYKVLGIDHLECRHMDEIDFHDIHVDALRQALEEAYQAGVKSMLKETPK